MRAVTKFAIMLFVGASAFAAQELAITKKRIEHLPKMIREQTFRGAEKIREELQLDTDDDGKMDYFFDLFYVHGEVLYWIKKDKERISTGFESHDAIQVIVAESTEPGKPMGLGFTDKDGMMLEAFQRRGDGRLEPLSQTELSDGASHFRKLQPMMNGVLDLIGTNNSQQIDSGNGRLRDRP